MALGVLVASCIGCALPKKVAAPTVTDVRRATVLVEAELGEDSWSGTGWYVYTDGAHSLVVTAGHVCEEGAKYTIEDYSGEHFAAIVLVDSDNTNDPEPSDTCVLVSGSEQSPNPAPYTLRLGASDGLDYGDRLFYVGFPGSQIAIVDGMYAGRDERPRLVMSVWGYFGASGSAVLGPDGTVVGMLVAINPHFPQTSFAVPVETVRAYVAKALLSLPQ